MQHPGSKPFDTANIRFAVIDSNVLACVGLQYLLGRLLPMAEIQVFSSIKELMELGDTSGFLHFFVSSNIYFEQANFFRQFPKKTIVLVKGDMQITGIHTLNICQNEQHLVSDMMTLQHMGHDRSCHTAVQRLHQQGDCRPTLVGYNNGNLASEKYYGEDSCPIPCRYHHLLCSQGNRQH